MLTNTPVLRLAQFGCGGWGKNLLRVATQLDRVKVRSVADPSAAAAAFVRSTYPDIEIRNSANEILDDQNIDAVIIAAPAADHYNLAKAALEHGKHVFVEKPLALTSRDASELVELSESRALTLMVGHTFLYNSVVRRVKDLIDSGELGDIYYVSARRINLGVARKDVNVIWNLAPHDVSILLYWLGQSPTRVSGTGRAFLQPGIHDVALFHLEFSKLVAHVELSWLNPLKVREMVIVGSRKMAVYDDVSTDQKLTIFDRGIDVRPLERQAPQWQTFGEFQLIQRQGDVTIPHIPFPEPLRVELEHFRDCIRDGAVPLTGGRHGLEVVKVLERVDHAVRAAGAADSLARV